MNAQENLYTPNCIRTHSGIYINPFDPQPDQITIEDIAHSLSMQCRFAGHLPKFYSVAQHSVECSFLVEHKYKLAALLHDSAEAYLLDIPSPVKNLLPVYKQAENNLLSMIAKKFGFQYQLSPAVKKADRVMLQFEWDTIMLRLSTGMNSYNFPSNNFFECWSPEQAKEEFLIRFHLINDYTRCGLKLKD